MVRIQRSVLKAVPFLLIGACTALAQQKTSPRFLNGDPLLTVPEVASAQNARLLGIDNLYDFVVESAKFKTNTSKPSLGINTLGDVPNSSWFTNRHASQRMTTEGLKTGARVHGAPVAPFSVIAAKTEGVTPGFRLRDARGYIYFVKVDPISNPEMSTASDVIGSLFFYAAGYNTPENYILIAKRSDFTIDPKATFSEPSGKKHPLTRGDLHKLVKRMPIGKDGEIRLMASLQIEGKILGPFRYSGSRTDDPNDLIPHEQRRDLRGMAVLAAWLNHTDAKADNTMDTLVGTGSEARVRHNMMDFGALFGSDSDIAKDSRHGQEFFLPTSKAQASKIVTLGLKPSPWETVHYQHDLPAMGNFTSAGFNPATWKPNYPNPAFLQMNTEDAYWGATLVMSFSDEDIKTIVDEGRYSNPAAAEAIRDVLERRRDAIGHYWFSRVLPLAHPRVEDGVLVVDDLAVKYKLTQQPPALEYNWASYDNDHDHVVPVEGHSATIPTELAKSESRYARCILSVPGQPQSVSVYFERDGASWKAVGLEHLSGAAK